MSGYQPGSGQPRPVVHEMFERQVRLSPSATALVEPGEETLTYAGLNARANRLAWLLRAHGVRRGDLVGLRARRSADCVAAMLGVLKAGAAYVPLEDGLPEDRLRWMVTECAPRLVITVPPLAEGVPVSRELSLARAAAELARQPDHDPGVAIGPDDLMYVPYTSGSTGRPKGTLVPHRSIPGFFAGTDYGGWGPEHVSLLHSALSWDGHVLELYPALLTGGRVVIAPGASADPVSLAQVASAQGVTYLFLTTALFNTIVDIDVSLLAGIRHLLFGGERASKRHVARALAGLPGTSLVHCYGPSECTAFTNIHVVTEADLGRPAIPIGRAVGDRRVYLLDDHGRPAPDGAVGELCVGGPGVAHGYLRRPRLTAERFVADPFSAVPGERMYRTGDRARRAADGTYEFIGRADSQVKIRGVRAEPGEIEAVLREHPQVKDAAVITAPEAAGDAQLVAYLVLAGTAEVTAGDLRRHLRRSLPEQMIPAKFARIDQIPLTPNVKTDRSALPAMASVWLDEPAGAAAETELEMRITAIWQQVLSLDQIGMDDSFFDLGGHSLSGIRLLSALRAVGYQIAASDFMCYQTIRSLAAHLSKQEPSRGRGGRAWARPRKSGSGETMQEQSEAGAASLEERFARDPYPVYTHLRRTAPVYQTGMPDGSTAWIVTRYADVRSALADGRLTKNPGTARQAQAAAGNGTDTRPGEPASPLQDNMLCTDPPRHTRLRKLINSAFTAGRVEGLRPRIQQIADDLINAIAPRGEADLVEEFATPLPVAVICELLGIPAIDHGKFRAWLTALAGITVTAQTDAARRAEREAADYFRQQVQRKRRSPGDDLLSVLLSTRVDGDALSDSELVSMLFLLVTAGHETTANLIGSGIHALLCHPGQMDLLRADPSLLPSAVEEFLRYESPFNVASARFTVEATEIGGVTIPPGEAVLPAIGSANRDPAQFPDPGRLDIRRDTRGSLAFGHGVHYCVGAPLARLEGEIAFGTLLRRLSGLRLAIPTDQLRWQRPCFLIRGLSELPVRFTPQPDGRLLTAGPGRP